MAQSCRGLATLALAVALLSVTAAQAGAETEDGGIDLERGPTLAVISTLELEQLLAAGGPMLLIDARGPELFVRGHLPGAINVPADQVGTLGPRLPTAPLTVVYCGGPSCPHSLIVGRWLIAHGRSGVLHYNAGFAAWRDTGHPIE